MTTRGYDLLSGMSVMLFCINCITYLEDTSYCGQFAGKKELGVNLQLECQTDARPGFISWTKLIQYSVI